MLNMFEAKCFGTFKINDGNRGSENLQVMIVNRCRKPHLTLNLESGRPANPVLCVPGNMKAHKLGDLIETVIAELRRAEGNSKEARAF